MAFRVGQKVVCVDDTLGPWGIGQSLIRNKIYTVSEISPFLLGWISPTTQSIESGIRVSEIVMPTQHDWFRAVRFRPVVERKTDISIFTAMLNPSKQTVDAH